jgi:hypothetical protein
MIHHQAMSYKYQELSVHIQQPLQLRRLAWPNVLKLIRQKLALNYEGQSPAVIVKFQ